MNELIVTIQNLKNSSQQEKIQKRIQEFKNIDRKAAEELFKELCFCILTANFNAERSIYIHSQLQEFFCTTSKESLSKKLRQYSYRFPNTRAAFIVNAFTSKDLLPIIIQISPGDRRRVWLVDNIEGLRYKESSHFLRNIGFDDYAIIDSHILEALEQYHQIKRLKTLTKKKYLKIERCLQNVAS